MLADDNAAIGVISQDLRDGYSLSDGAVQALLNAAKRQTKPTAFMTNFGGVRRAALTAHIDANGSCVLFETAPALAAIRNRLSFRDFRFDAQARSPLALSETQKSLLKPGAALSEKESLELLAGMGLNILPSVMVRSAEELAARKAELRYPAVVKTAVPGILHKADVGGVKLNLADYGQVAAAYEDMAGRLGKEAVVVPQFKFDTELIFGMKTDPTFGPLVIVGAGGILTELLRDRIILLPSASRREIRDKLAKLKVYKLLCGFRGTAPVDIEHLVSQIERFCEIAATVSGLVKEIDVNPFAVSGNEMMALDGLVICEK
jgi:acyl-CoA synthetase (NDP forming)